MSKKFVNVIRRTPLSEVEISLCKLVSLLPGDRGKIAKNILSVGHITPRQLRLLKKFKRSFQCKEDYNEEDYLVTDYDLCIGAYGD